MIWEVGLDTSWRYVVELNVIGFEELELFGIYIEARVTADGLK